MQVEVTEISIVIADLTTGNVYIYNRHVDAYELPKFFGYF
jgi:hypothetical protein